MKQSMLSLQDSYDFLKANIETIFKTDSIQHIINLFENNKDRIEKLTLVKQEELDICVGLRIANPQNKEIFYIDNLLPTRFDGVIKIIFYWNEFYRLEFHIETAINLVRNIGVYMAEEKNNSFFLVEEYSNSKNLNQLTAINSFKKSSLELYSMITEKNKVIPDFNLYQLQYDMVNAKCLYITFSDKLINQIIHLILNHCVKLNKISDK